MAKPAVLTALILACLGIAPLCGLTPGGAAYAGTTDDGAIEPDPFDSGEPDEAAVPPIADPLARVNHAFYVVNDKLYFWVFRPVARGYKAVVPRIARVGVDNFFDNLGMPRRAVNCLLQGDLKGTGTEAARFGVNTTVGVLGFGNPAKGWLKLEQRDEDFGQTLGVWGLGHGCYLTLPLMGPSSARDGLGSILDSALDPASYAGGASAVKRVNSVSLSLGDYEALKDSALDPYVAIRDAYNQHRRHAVQIRW